jgi:hypothetical protein
MSFKAVVGLQVWMLSPELGNMLWRGKSIATLQVHSPLTVFKHRRAQVPVIAAKGRPMATLLELCQDLQRAGWRDKPNPVTYVKDGPTEYTRARFSRHYAIALLRATDLLDAGLQELHHSATIKYYKHILRLLALNTPDSRLQLSRIRPGAALQNVKKQKHANQSPPTAPEQLDVLQLCWKLTLTNVLRLM